MYAQYDDGGGAAAAGLGIGSFLVFLIIFVIAIAAMWKMFEKAGQPGWAAIIPIYNLYIMLQIIGRPWWWLILLIIPFVNFVILIIISLDIAKAFGKGVGFGIGLILLGPIFYCILGFGDSQYQGPPAAA